MTDHNIGPGAVEEAAGVQQTSEDENEPTPRPANDPATAEGETDQDDDA